MEKVSVIVPIYNVEEYIHKCIDSIISQTYSNIEIILVDDGSPDSCPKICDIYKQNDDRIRVIHKQNGGLSDARNYGLDIATGDYIIFVDSDDYISNDMIEKLHSAIKKGEADISICNFNYIDPEGNYDYSKENSDLPVRDEVITAEEVLKNKIQKNKSWYWVIACCKLYKRELFKNIRFKVGKLHEDEFIFHEIFLKANRVACISDSLYFYQQRRDSIMGNNINCRRLDGAEALLMRCEAYLEIPGYEKAAVFELLSSASKFHGYYCSSHIKLDKEHKKRNNELQKKFRILFRKMVKKQFEISARDWLKIGVNYVSLYYSGKIVHRY